MNKLKNTIRVRLKISEFSHKTASFLSPKLAHFFLPKLAQDPWNFLGRHVTNYVLFFSMTVSAGEKQPLPTWLFFIIFEQFCKREGLWEGISYNLLTLQTAGWRGNKQRGGGDAKNDHFTWKVKWAGLKPLFPRFTKWLVFLLDTREPQIRSLSPELLNILMFPLAHISPIRSWNQYLHVWVNKLPSFEFYLLGLQIQSFQFYRCLLLER